MPTYQLAVEKIMQNRAILTDQDRLLSIVGRPAGCPYVNGHTNADGSLIIFFPVRGHNARFGYLYYSGAQVVARPNKPNEYSLAGYDNLGRYYVHMTNGWYEY